MSSKDIHLLLLHHSRICGTYHWHQHSFIFTVNACLCYLESPLDHHHGFGWTFCKFFPTLQSSAGGDVIHFLVLQVTPLSVHWYFPLHLPDAHMLQANKTCCNLGTPFNHSRTYGTFCWHQHSFIFTVYACSVIESLCWTIIMELDGLSANSS